MKSSGIKQRSTRKWTVVIVRRFGKISSHEISGFWFKAAAVLLVLILAGAGYLFYQNRELSAERQELMARLVLPPAEDEGPMTTPKNSGTVTTLVKKAASTTTTTTTTTAGKVTTTTLAATTTTEPETTTTAPQEEETTTTLARTETESGTESGTENGTEARESERIQVDGVKLSLLTRPKGIKVSYKLVNKDGQGKKITGYTFALAKNDELDPSLVASFPKTTVFDEEQPDNHKRGVAFAIYQFKTIRGRLYSPKPVKEIVILVYDREGKLLFRKSYPVPGV